MRAFVYHGVGKRALEDKPKPTVKEPIDAVVKSILPPRSLWLIEMPIDLTFRKRSAHEAWS
jgi:hypothetical protein